MQVQLNPIAGSHNTGARKPDSPEKLRQSAQDFESLLIAQLLKSARGDENVWGTGDDKTAESIIDMAEEKVAEALAVSGGLGLAQMITTSMQAPSQMIQNGTLADKESRGK
jgi:Rod binding domain-containing protein